MKTPTPTLVNELTSVFENLRPLINHRDQRITANVRPTVVAKIDKYLNLVGLSEPTGTYFDLNVMGHARWLTTKAKYIIPSKRNEFAAIFEKLELGELAESFPCLETYFRFMTTGDISFADSIKDSIIAFHMVGSNIGLHDEEFIDALSDHLLLRSDDGPSGASFCGFGMGTRLVSCNKDTPSLIRYGRYDFRAHNVSSVIRGECRSALNYLMTAEDESRPVGKDGKRRKKHIFRTKKEILVSYVVGGEQSASTDVFDILSDKLEQQSASPSKSLALEQKNRIFKGYLRLLCIPVDKKLTCSYAVETTHNEIKASVDKWKSGCKLLSEFRMPFKDDNLPLPSFVYPLSLWHYLYPKGSTKPRDTQEIVQAFFGETDSERLAMGIFLDYKRSISVVLPRYVSDDRNFSAAKNAITAIVILKGEKMDKSSVEWLLGSTLRQMSDLHRKYHMVKFKNTFAITEPEKMFREFTSNPSRALTSLLNRMMVFIKWGEQNESAKPLAILISNNLSRLAAIQIPKRFTQEQQLGFSLAFIHRKPKTDSTQTQTQENV